MKVVLATSGMYEPKFNGNRELPENERIKVYHRYLTYAERNKFVYTKPLRIGRDGEIGDIEYVQDAEGIARAIITKIENLVIECDGKQYEIKTAKELYENPYVPTELVSEIQAYCLTATPEVQKNPTV